MEGGRGKRGAADKGTLGSEEWKGEGEKRSGR